MEDVNKWKDALDKAASEHVKNHKDQEVRMMFGHYYRMFCDGARWENDRKSHRIKSLEEGLKNLVDAIPGDGTWDYQAACENARKLLNL